MTSCFLPARAHSFTLRMRSKPPSVGSRRGRTISRAMPPTVVADAIVPSGSVISHAAVVSDLAYIENDAWWGWAFAPGGFVLGPSILFALYILGTLVFDLVKKQTKTKEEEE